MNTRKAFEPFEAPNDFADFAQEFVRRNPAYRADYQAWVAGEPDANAEVWGRACDRWGLVFPDRP